MLSKEQAIKLANSNWYKDLPAKDIVNFQLFEERLCMPFSEFHKAIEEVLNRPVYTHEFAYPEELRKEYLGDKLAPTFEEIINLIPQDKKIIVGILDAKGNAEYHKVNR